MTRRKVVAGSLMVLVGLLVGLLISSNLGIQKLTLATETGISEHTTEFLSRLSASLSEIAEKVKPSVVNISTTKTIITSIMFFPV